MIAHVPLLGLCSKRCALLGQIDRVDVNLLTNLDEQRASVANKQDIKDRIDQIHLRAAVNQGFS